MRCPGCKEELSEITIVQSIRRSAIVNPKGAVVDVMPPDDYEDLENTVSFDSVERVECGSCGENVTKIVKIR